MTPHPDSWRICPVHDCTQMIPQSALVCRGHLDMLPQEIKGPLYASFGTDEWPRLRDEAIEWLRDRGMALPRSR